MQTKSLRDFTAKFSEVLSNAKEIFGIRSTKEYSPTPETLSRQMVERTRLAGLLPWMAYDQNDSIFVTDEGIGFCLEILPQIGGGDEMTNILSGLISGCVGGAGVQISLLSDGNILGSLDAIYRLRTNAIVSGASSHESEEKSRIYKSIYQRRIAFYKSGSVKPIFPSIPFLFTNYRIVLSAVLPLDFTKEEDKLSAITLRDSMRATLNSAGFVSQIWTADQFVQWNSRLLNLQKFHRTEECWPSGYDTGRLLREQVVDRDTLCNVTATGLYFSSSNDPRGITEARFYSVKSYPPAFPIQAVRGLLGDYFQTSLQYTTPFCITMSMTTLDHESFKTYAQLKQARAVSNSGSMLARFMPELGEQRRDWDLVVQSLSQGGSMVKCHHQLMLFGEPKHMARAEQAARAVWRSRNFELMPDRFLQVKGLLASLPLTMSRKFSADLGMLGLLSTKTSKNAVSMSPLLAEWKGTSTPVLTLFGRLGQIMSIDVFDNTSGNYNAAIAGVSGSGKSVLLNEIALSYLSIGTKVWIIDVGRSYEKLCHNLGGEFIEFTPDKPICLNPFSNISDIDEDMEMLKPLLGQMISPSQPLQDFERAQIEKALRSVWLNKGTESTISDISDHFLHQAEIVGDSRIKDMGEMLYPFTRHGVYGRYFEGKSTIGFDNQFTVLEMEELKAKKDLQSVVLLIMLYRINQVMYLERDQRKIVIIDEAWDLMGGGSTSEFIETGYRRARKYRGSYMTATQGWDDYYKNPAALAALQNSDWTFMLRQKKESIDSLIDNKRLSADDYLKRLLMSIKTEHGVFSEVFVNSQMGAGIGRLIVDPFSLLMFSSKAEDYYLINKKIKSGMNVAEAIESVLKERGVNLPNIDNFDSEVMGYIPAPDHFVY